MSLSDPVVDFAKIVFPSDQLSFGMLRQRFPDLIDRASKVTFFELPGPNAAFHVQNLTNLLEGERELAMSAFNRAVGRDWEMPSGHTDDEVRQYLIEDYIRYGVASGEQHAVQLIRDIEATATEQAHREARLR
jgi:hypothetical protein